MTEFICQTCGDVVTMDDNTDPWDCVECGDRMVPRDKSDVVPKDELRELVERWRAMAEKAGPEEFEIAYSNAAEEAEELLE